MFPYDDLVKKAKFGPGLSGDEIRLLVDYLGQPHEESGYFQALSALAWVRAPEHEAVVSRFLDAGTDPQIAAQAIRVLVNWGLGSKYTNMIFDFINGVPWDDGDIKQKAILVAGDIYRLTSDVRLLEKIMQIFEDRNAMLLDRSCAYISIQRALCVDSKSIIEFSNERAWEMAKSGQIIQQARLLLSSSD